MILKLFLFLIIAKPCPKSNWNCDHFTKCLHKNKICDHKVDCNDYSDELHCFTSLTTTSTITTPTTSFTTINKNNYSVNNNSNDEIKHSKKNNKSSVKHKIIYSLIITLLIIIIFIFIVDKIKNIRKNRQVVNTKYQDSINSINNINCRDNINTEQFDAIYNDPHYLVPVNENYIPTYAKIHDYDNIN